MPNIANNADHLTPWAIGNATPNISFRDPGWPAPASERTTLASVLSWTPACRGKPCPRVHVSRLASNGPRLRSSCDSRRLAAQAPEPVEPILQPEARHPFLGANQDRRTNLVLQRVSFLARLRTSESEGSRFLIAIRNREITPGRCDGSEPSFDQH